MDVDAEITRAFQKPRLDPHAKMRIDLLSGGYIWSDEKPPTWEHSAEVRTVLSQLVYYRGCLVMGQPQIDDEHEREVLEDAKNRWEEIKKVCPDWPGFRPERCKPEHGPELREALDDLIAE